MITAPKVSYKFYKSVVDLSRTYENSDFDNESKEQVEARVGMCSGIQYEDDRLGGNCTNKGEIEKCIY